METYLMHRLGYEPLGINGQTPDLSGWTTYTSTSSGVVYAKPIDHQEEIEQIKKQIEKYRRTAPAKVWELTQRLKELEG